MSDETTGVEIPEDDPRALELLLAVHGGDIDTIRRLLAEDPQLPRAGLVDRKGGFRTLLHLVTDWPGYFPDSPWAHNVQVREGRRAPNGPTAGGRRKCLPAAQKIFG